jgi:hypothetical protein
MREVYEGNGVTFEYPEDWELTEQVQDDECLITVSGPGTSFWSVGLFCDRPNTEIVLDTVVAAFRDDYPDLDSYPIEDEILGQPASGFDLEFFCLELVNTACVRSFMARDFTVMILSQAEDSELAESKAIFEWILESFDCELPSDDNLDAEMGLDLEDDEDGPYGQLERLL